MRRGLRISLALAVLLCGSARGADEIEVAFDDASGKTGAFVVRGLDDHRLESLRESVAETGRIFAVYSGSDADGSVPAMLGRYAVEDGAVVFRPRFPLKGGLVYTAVYRPAGGRSVVRKEFRIPKAPAGDPARITQVYPTADRLPENLLKFYLHFSAPMRRGDSYRFLHLIEEGGPEVEYPFLELGEELWNEDGTRLTVFFDPGRIKRGLKPREEVGPALEEGKRYVLRIDRDWPDATGRPLERGFEKHFAVLAPDDAQPDPQRWKIAAPPPNSTRPLVVEFNEPLDHAMLHRVVRVRGGEGTFIAGRVKVSQRETRWEFVPERPWKPGDHDLVVETILEDLAGNSIGRPFEVDVVRPIERTVAQREVEIPFVVGRD